MSLWSWFSATDDNQKNTNNEGGCPVDHKTREQYVNANMKNIMIDKSGKKLSAEREVSTIPRFVDTSDASFNGGESISGCPVNHSSSNVDTQENGKWVYPSPKQFYEALARKNRDARAEDMDVVVPIHNAVNERCWSEILEWERSGNKEDVSGVKLVSFRGRPNDRSPRAWMKVLTGYTAPFDRHDWIVAREDGTRLRYVIDFYTGKESSSKIAFHLDVRPALDGAEGVRMRMGRMVNRNPTELKKE